MSRQSIGYPGPRPYYEGAFTDDLKALGVANFFILLLTLATFGIHAAS